MQQATISGRYLIWWREKEVLLSVRQTDGMSSGVLEKGSQSPRGRSTIKLFTGSPAKLATGIRTGDTWGWTDARLQLERHERQILREESRGL